MRKIVVDFGTENNILPYGNMLGYLHEHNATELVIIPPLEMTKCEKISKYVVAFVAKGKVIRSDFYPKSDRVIVFLSKHITDELSYELQLEAYDESEKVIMKSLVISGLYFKHSIHDDEIKNAYFTSFPSENTDGDAHTHSNKELLDGLTPDMLGGSSGVKVASFAKENFKFWEGEQAGYMGYLVDVTPSDYIPENATIVDIGIVFYDENGNETECRSAHMQSAIGFGENCRYYIYAYPFSTSPNFPGEYPVIRFYEENIIASPLYGKTSNEDYIKVNVYFLGGGN